MEERQWVERRRRDLNDELRELEQQKQKVQRRLDELAVMASAPRVGPGPGALASVPSKAGRKRPPNSVPGPAAHVVPPAVKRQKLESERQKRVSSLWSQCRTVINSLLKTRDCGAFLKPVDPVALMCPDYFDIVKKPMSISVIQSKLNANPRQYNTLKEFTDDVRQIWDNCRMYNAPTHAVRIAGEKMSEIWERKWQSIDMETKFAEEAARQRAEDNGQEWTGLTNGLHAGDPSLPKRMQEMDSELKELHLLMPNKPKDPSAVPQRVSWADMRKLSIAIGNLPGEKISQVMQIIEAGSYGQQLASDGGDGEVELELDDLDDQTLRALQKYINEEAKHTAKPTRPQTPAKDNRGGPVGASAAATRPPGQNGAVPTAAQNGVEGPAGHAAASRPATPAQGAPSPSSSSSSSGSDSSSSESDDEAHSRRENVGDTSTFNHGGQAEGGHGEVTTLVSATGKQSDPSAILKNATTRPKAVEVDQAAWANLDDKDGGEEAGPADAPQDDLWQEFKSRDQVANDKAQEEKAQKDRDQAEKEKAEAEARRKVEEAEAAKRAAAAAREHEAHAEIEAQRQRELAQLQIRQGDDEVAPAAGADDALLLAPKQKQKQQALPSTLQLKDDSDSDSSDSDEDNEGGMAMGSQAASGMEQDADDDQEEEGEL